MTAVKMETRRQSLVAKGMAVDSIGTRRTTPVVGLR